MDGKFLSDGKEVSPRTWYYLLDFNDRDSKVFMTKKFGKNRLSDLTKTEYIELFHHATEMDKIHLINI